MSIDIRRVLVAGLVSSVVMGMVSMIGEALAGTGLWSSPILIAATLMRDLQSLQSPVPFLFIPLMLGLMGHMMNSVALTGLFQALMGQKLVGSAQLGAAGAVFGLLVFVMMWFLVLPILNPVMLILSPVVFGAAHVMWGAVLGLLLAQK